MIFKTQIPLFPKKVLFSYRVALAVLSGEDKGEGSVFAIRVSCTYEWVQQLLMERRKHEDNMKKFI